MLSDWKPQFIFNWDNFQRKIMPFETVAREEFLVSEILRLNKLRIGLWKARKIPRTKFLTENFTRNCKNFCEKGHRKRRFLKVVNLFLLFPNNLPFGKSVALHLNKLESPSPRDTLCQVWLKLAQWSGEEDENVKSSLTDGRTDRRLTTGDQKSSLELSAQVS